jgi:hypothetical protein
MKVETTLRVLVEATVHIDTVDDPEAIAGLGALDDKYTPITMQVRHVHDPVVRYEHNIVDRNGSQLTPSELNGFASYASIRVAQQLAQAAEAEMNRLAELIRVERAGITPTQAKAEA